MITRNYTLLTSNPSLTLCSLDHRVVLINTPFVTWCSVMSFGVSVSLYEVCIFVYVLFKNIVVFGNIFFVSWTIRTINNEKTATGMVYFNIWSAPLVLSFYDSQNEVSRIGVHLKFPMHSNNPWLRVESNPLQWQKIFKITL